MTPIGLPAARLEATLAALPSHDLQGVALMRAHDVPSDVPRDALRTAVAEMVAYAEASRAAARRLSDLRPIPLTERTVVFGL